MQEIETTVTLLYACSLWQYFSSFVFLTTNCGQLFVSAFRGTHYGREMMCVSLCVCVCVCVCVSAGVHARMCVLMSASLIGKGIIG